MAMGVETLATLTIPNGDDESDLLSAHLSQGQMKTVIGSLEQLSVACPAALTNAVHIQVSQTYPGVTFRPLEDYLGNPPVLGAGLDVGVPYVTFKDLKFVSAGNEGAARAFILTGKLNYPAS